MASLTIDNLEDGVLSRLRSRADARGISLEEEAAAIIERVLREDRRQFGTRRSLAASIRSKFEPFGPFDLDLPPRDPAWEPPRFDD